MEIKPIYLFYGDETYLIEKDLKIFRDYFSDQDCTVESFDGAKADLDVILEAAATSPLFGAQRLIIVRNSPWFAAAKKKESATGAKAAEDKEKDVLKEQREQINAYVADFNTDVCLVFVAENASKTLKSVKAIMEVGKVREYKKPREWELPSLLRQYLRKQGKNIAPKALDLLVTIGGEELGLLINECDKLVIYAEDRENIEETDIYKVVSQSAAANIFQLSDALGRRNIGEVKRLTNGFMAEMKAWEYPQIFGYITNYLILLMRIKEHLAKGLREDEIVKITKINAYRVKLGIPAANNYTMSELTAGLRLMLAVDFKMKSGKASFKDSFPAALMAITAKYA